jgi:recombination protein RecT
MSEIQTTNQNKPATLNSLIGSEAVMERFKQVLGDSAKDFAASILSLSTASPALKQCDPKDVINCCLIAATLKLQLNPALGQCHVIPYNSKQPDGTFKMVPQFQVGYKGIKQLCIRSGMFKQMNATPIYAGQLINVDPLRGIYEFDFSVEQKGDPIGYAAYFMLQNADGKPGFEKTFYMNTAQIIAHAKRYSKSYAKGFGPWKDDFQKMALKTVSKLNLNGGEAPMSVDYQRAIKFDQATPKNENIEDVEYIDGVTEQIENKENEVKTEPIQGDLSNM